MKIHTNKLALTTGIVFSVLWVICSAFILLIPDITMALTGIMFHANLSSMAWALTWGGFFMGLIAWAILGGTSAWLISFFYNHSLDQ